MKQVLGGINARCFMDYNRVMVFLVKYVMLTLLVGPRMVPQSIGIMWTNQHINKEMALDGEILQDVV